MWMWLRLALVIGAVFAVAESADVIVTIALGRVPNETTEFWGSPFSWETVVFNVAASSAIVGAMFSFFLVLTDWKWPRKLDRWLTRESSN
jgi:hypothetical protein